MGVRVWGFPWDLGFRVKGFSGLGFRGCRLGGSGLRFRPEGSVFAKDLHE